MYMHELSWIIVFYDNNVIVHRVIEYVAQIEESDRDTIDVFVRETNQYTVQKFLFLGRNLFQVMKTLSYCRLKRPR